MEHLQNIWTESVIIIFLMQYSPEVESLFLQSCIFVVLLASMNSAILFICTDAPVCARCRLSQGLKSHKIELKSRLKFRHIAGLFNLDWKGWIFGTKLWLNYWYLWYPQWLLIYVLELSFSLSSIHYYCVSWSPFCRQWWSIWPT